jgi:hypothetical protein
MVSQEAVTPVETGVPESFNELKTLDSVFRRNDEKRRFLSFSQDHHA